MDNSQQVLGIRYADGVALTSDEVPGELLEYAASLGKPTVKVNTVDIDAAPLVEFYKALGD